MSQDKPKARSPWSTLAVGTRVTIDGVTDATIIQVRRKKYAQRYRVELSPGTTMLVRRPDLRVVA